MTFTQDEIMQFMVASRAEQGLPAYITDEEDLWVSEAYGSGSFEQSNPGRSINEPKAA